MAGENEDIKQKIILDYETNAKETAKEVDKLDDSIESVNESQKKVEKSTKKTTKAQKSATKSSKDQKKGLDGIGGAVGGAITGFKALLKQMWLIVANPVGLVILAIVGGLALLFKAFTSTKAGAEKFEQIMDGISATIDVLRDRVLNIGRAIAKFFSGDFKGAVEEGRAAVSGFGEEVAREFQIAADARRSLQEVADAMRDLSVTRAKLNRDLIKAKETIEGSTASYEEKTAAIDAVKKAETEQTELELANAQKKLDAIIIQNAQSDSGKEALDAQAQAQIAVFNLEAESARNRTKFIKLQEIADIDEASRIKKISDGKAADAKLEEEAFKAFLERGKVREEKRKKEDEERQKLADQRVEDNRLLQEHLDEEERIEEEAEDLRVQKAFEAAQKEIEIEQFKLDQKKAIRDAEIGLIGQGLKLLSSIFGKNKKLQKGILIAENALGIAKTVISTQASNAATIAEGAALAIPTAGASVAAAAALVTANNISAGISIAAIVAATAKGLSALGGGSAGGASRPSSPEGGASASPQVGFQASRENQIATTIADNTADQEPVKAFVVSSDITTAQALDRNKIESNSL